jgi:hypothetical protein
MKIKLKLSVLAFKSKLNYLHNVKDFIKSSKMPRLSIDRRKNIQFIFPASFGKSERKVEVLYRSN